MQKALFTEKQRFTQWWIGLIFIAGFVPLCYSLYKIFLLNPEIELTAKLVLLLGCLIYLAVVFLMYPTRLETAVYSNGINVRLFPFQIQPVYYEWTCIRKAYIRRYRPIPEY